MGRVEGKVALITGAGSGLGRESAIHLAKEGAKVIASDLNEKTAQETAATINENHGKAAISIKHDVNKEYDWNNTLEQVIKEFGNINILINNAGISIGGDIETTEFSDWKKLYPVSYTHLTLPTKA